MYDVDENGMIDLNEMTRLVKSIFKVSQSKVICPLLQLRSTSIYVSYITSERNLKKSRMKRKPSMELLVKTLDG